MSVALNIASRAREYSYHFARDGRSMLLSFHCRSGSSMRAWNRRSCSLFPTSSQNLMRMMPASMIYFSNTGHSFRNSSYSLSVQNPITCSTPARLYQLRSKITISPAGREMLHVALHVHLALLAVRRRRQRHEPEHARADALGDRLDRPALAGGVPPFEDHDHALAFVLTQSCRGHSLPCSLMISFSYSLRLSFLCFLSFASFFAIGVILYGCQPPPSVR